MPPLTTRHWLHCRHPDHHRLLPQVLKSGNPLGQRYFCWHVLPVCHRSAVVAGLWLTDRRLVNIIANVITLALALLIIGMKLKLAEGRFQVAAGITVT